VPEARLEVTSDGEPDIAGLATQVCGTALAELIGYERRYDLKSGLHAHIGAARCRLTRSLPHETATSSVNG
jgi:UDP-glucose 4-epimerase